MNLKSAPTKFTKNRQAVNFAFFVNGIVFGSWAAHIPSIQSKFDLTEAAIGNLLLVIGIGAVLVMIVTAWLINRLGSCRLTIIAALFYAVSLPLLFLAPNIFWLTVAAFLFGAGNGSIDVSMNDQAIMVQQKYGRSIMSSFHGVFSVGGLMAAGIAVLVLSAGGTPLQQAWGVSILIIVFAVVFFPHLIKEHSRKVPSKKPFPFIFDPKLLLLAFLTFIVFMSEGAIADWSALYLRDYNEANNAEAALGYAAFSLTMIIGRLSGDIFVQRYGNNTVMFMGGLLLAIGMSLLIFFPSLSNSLIGFALAGAGLANLIPICFSRSGNLSNISASIGIATVSTTGYAGFLLGTPIIGNLAHYFGLPQALALLIMFGFIVVIITLCRLIRF